MISAVKMSFAALLAAVVISLVEQLVPTGINFDQIILPVSEVQTTLGESIPFGITLRYGIIALAGIIGQWIKRRVAEQGEAPPITLPSQQRDQADA